MDLLDTVPSPATSYSMPFGRPFCARISARSTRLTMYTECWCGVCTCDLAHASTTRMMRKTREIARLRTRTACNREALGPDDAMAVEMEVGELAVARRMLQPHRIDGPAGAGTDVGHLVLEAIWQADLCPDFRTVDRAADGLAIHFHVIGYAQPTLPPFDVDLELDRQKPRLVHGVDR